MLHINVVCITGIEWKLNFVRQTVIDSKFDKHALQAPGEHDLLKCSHLSVTQHL